MGRECTDKESDSLKISHSNLACSNFLRVSRCFICILCSCICFCITCSKARVAFCSSMRSFKCSASSCAVLSLTYALRRFTLRAVDFELRDEREDLVLTDLRLDCEA